MQETPVRFLGWEDPLEKGKLLTPVFGASVVSQLVKNPPAMWETWVQSLSWERSSGEGKRSSSSILAWRIPWTVYSMGSQRVGQDWANFTFTFTIWIHHFDYPFVNGYLEFFSTHFSLWWIVQLLSVNFLAMQGQIKDFLLKLVWIW